MKKNAVILIFFFTVSLYSQDANLSNMDNFSFIPTVKNLNMASARELNSYIENGLWVVLDGSLSSITRLSGRDEEYLIETSLVQGEWQDLEKVVKYTCRAIFQGDSWMEIIPERVPREPSENMIILNTHVLVLGQLISFEQSEGMNIPYILVDQIRKIP